LQEKVSEDILLIFHLNEKEITMNSKILALLCALTSVLTTYLDAKPRLLTFHYNLPQFIELQHKTLQKFMCTDYELIVFNDARTEEMAQQIQATCDACGIQCIRYEQEWHTTHPLNTQISEYLKTPGVHSHITFDSSDPKVIGEQASVRHCHVIQYALDHYGYDHDDLVVIMDGDIFPIKPIHLYAITLGSDITGIYKEVPENDVSYFWVPFIALDMPSLPNKKDLRFHVDLIDDYVHDSGAHSFHYLENNPKVTTKKFSWLCTSHYSKKSASQMKRLGLDRDAIQLVKRLLWPMNVELHIEQHFLHFGGSSFVLWDHQTKEQVVTEFLNEILAK
jgi:hypothetical protein